MRRILCLAFTLVFSACADREGSGDRKTELPWNAYYAASAVDLPTCAGNIIGRLYFVEDADEFRACKSTGWETINVSGTKLVGSFACEAEDIGLDLRFEYHFSVYTDNSVFVSCTVTDGGIPYSSSYVWIPGLPAANAGACFVRYDHDGTDTGGYWQFADFSGIKKATFVDLGEPDDGAEVDLGDVDSCRVP